MRLIVTYYHKIESYIFGAMGGRSAQWCTPRAWLLRGQKHPNLLLSWWQTACPPFARNSRRSIKVDGKGEPKGMKRAKPVRYTAAKLHEKGVLLGIDDLQTNQWVWPGTPQNTPPRSTPHTSLTFLWSLRPLRRASFGLSGLTLDDRCWGDRCINLSRLPSRPGASGGM